MVFAMAFVLMGGLALADTPHGPFADSTDLCAACHRAHTAQAEYLIADTNTLGICTACHDGSGADTNVVTGTYVVNGSWVSSMSGDRAAATLLNGATTTDVDVVDDTIVVDSTTGYLVGQQIAIGAANAQTNATAPGSWEFATIVSVTPPTTLVVSDLTASHVDNSIVGNATESASDHDTWGTAGEALLGGGFQAVTGGAATSAHISNLGASTNNLLWNIQFGENAAPGAATTALTCVSCHIPHRSGNYRMLRMTPQGANDETTSLVVADNFVRETGVPVTDPNYGKVTSSHYYTDNEGRFNIKRAGSNDWRNTASQGISAWCGACHDYYYTYAQKGATGDSDTAPVVTTHLDTATTAVDTDIDVDSATGLAIGDTIVINKGASQITRVISNIVGTTVTIDSAVGAIYPINTSVVAVKSGSGIYYNVDGVAGADLAYMHSVDVDLVYTPRNSSTAGSPISLWANLGLTAGADDARTYHDTLPVAQDVSAVGLVNYDNTDEITCLTCHRAHGTEAAMTGNARIGVINRLGVAGADSMANSVLLRLPNRAVCETCHKMPTGY